MSAAIEISISELHEHTDRYVREAAAKRILITDHGKPVAELQPATPALSSEVPYFARRKLRPEFQKMMESGAFRPRPGHRDITDLISDDREGNGVICFDTSQLVRLYVEDPGQEVVRALAATDDVASAVHGRIETVAAFHRILREGRVDVVRFGELLKQFLDDCTAFGLHWLPLTEAALSRVETAYASLPATVFLLAADALHLACAAEHGFTGIHSNDARLLAAAPRFGIRGVNAIP